MPAVPAVVEAPGSGAEEARLMSFAILFSAVVEGAVPFYKRAWSGEGCALGYLSNEAVASMVLARMERRPLSLDYYPDGSERP